MHSDPELEPYLVYRVAGDQLECAVWTLREGPRALALFQNGELADAYRHGLGLGEEWSVFRPGRNDLLTILRHCHETGITLAVLDPDHQQARRVFDIHAIVQGAGEPPR
jgi:hypothetical protein